MQFRQPRYCKYQSTEERFKYLQLFFITITHDFQLDSTQLTVETAVHIRTYSSIRIVKIILNYIPTS